MTAKQCLKCGGSGGGDEPHLICPDCNGTGERKEKKTALQNAFRYSAADLTVQHSVISEKLKEKKEYARD